MTAREIWNWIGDHLFGIIMFLSIFIQIAPIKINPWTKILKWISKIVTEDTEKNIKDVKTLVTENQRTINENQKTINENEKDRIRWEILDFANSCRNGRKHTKDEFEHIITLQDKYKALLEKTNDKNGVFEAEYDYILRVYHERQEKNDFL